MDAARRSTWLRHLGFVAAVGVAKSSYVGVCAVSECRQGNLGEAVWFAFAYTLGDMLIVGTIWLLVVLGERVPVRTWPLTWTKGCATALTAGIGGALTGRLLVAPLEGLAPAWFLEAPHWWGPDAFAFMVFWHSVVAALLYAWWSFDRRSRTLDAAANDAELMRIAAERSWDETRYQLLQAQIEPHFIFNSLANVRRLLRTDPAAADQLLDDLLRYFEHALPRLRDERSTLGHEVELVHAFLAVHQVRMGQRLRTRIELPGELASLDVPPMLLLTLVENALKHGVQPLVEGGEISVAIRLESGRISLSVADTGAGMGSGHGGGSGLANTRARLRSLYGDAAKLSLRVNEPRGVVATIDLPLGAAA